jgi:hypothetical protein
LGKVQFLGKATQLHQIAPKIAPLKLRAEFRVEVEGERENGFEEDEVKKAEGRNPPWRTRRSGESRIAHLHSQDWIWGECEWIRVMQ